MLNEESCHQPPKPHEPAPETTEAAGTFGNPARYVTPMPGFVYLCRPAPPHGPTALERAIEELRNRPPAPPRPKPHPRAVARAVGLWLAVLSRRRPSSVLSGHGFTAEVAKQAAALAATSPLPAARELRSLRIHIMEDLTVRFTASVSFDRQIRALIGSMRPCRRTRRLHAQVLRAAEADAGKKKKRGTSVKGAAPDKQEFAPRWSVDAIEII